MSLRFKGSVSLFLTLLMLLTMLPSVAFANTTDTVMAKLGNRGFKEVVDLGVAASSVSLKTSLVAKENGKDVVYTTADGGKFNVVDIKENKLLFAAQLGDVSQAWTHSITKDGVVYIGGLGVDFTGEIWGYTPGTRMVKKLATLDSKEQIWSSATDEEGNVYVGTYPNGKVIKYSPADGKLTDLGQVDSQCGYVRSMAYYDGYIYAGLGVSGKVYRINATTFEKEDITKNMPELVGKTIENIKFAYDMAVVGKHLFVRVDDGGNSTLVFYDLENQSWVNKSYGKQNNNSADDYGAFGFSNQLAVHDNKAYVVYQRHIYTIDLTTFEAEDTGLSFGAGFRGAGFVTLDEGIRFVTANRDGSIRLINFETSTPSFKNLPVVMEAMALTLHNLAKGNDGNLYMTTYPGGPKGARYNPKTDSFISYSQGQAEGIIAGNGNDLYFGMYPGAVIQKKDTETMAITTMFNLKDTYEQDRPYIMKFEDNKLLIGTIPDYAKLGGTLTIYDTITEERETYRNVVQDQSIVGLTSKDGKIYGSTTIRGGLDIAPTATEAKIFVWDMARNEKVSEISLEIPGLKNPIIISGLTFGEDGLLWGAVEGIIFAMDPVSLKVVKYKNIYPEIVGRGMWRPVHIIFGEDGLLYTDVGGKLTVLDPDTLEHASLVTSGPEVDFITLARDAEGNENIYFIDGSAKTLKMVPVIDGGELAKPPVSIEIEVPVNNSGLEKAVTDEGIPGWTSLFSNITANVSFEVSNERSYAGSNSLKIKDTAQNETVFAQSDLIPVQEGIEYTASVQMFLEDGSASFFFRYFDENGKQVGKDADGVNIIHVRSGHKEWQKVKAVVTAPAGAKYARLFAGTSNYFTTNGAYYDEFKISYMAEVIAEVELAAEVMLDGKAAEGSDYSFQLKASDDKVIQTKNNEGGKVAFDKLSFISEGSYSYTINQVIGSNDRMVYDRKIYEVTIEVISKDGKYVAEVSYKKDGEVLKGIPVFKNKAKPTKPEKPVKPEKPTKPEKPVKPGKPVKPSMM